MTSKICKHMFQESDGQHSKYIKKLKAHHGLAIRRTGEHYDIFNYKQNTVIISRSELEAIANVVNNLPSDDDIKVECGARCPLRRKK
jgi:hypothetical protein